MKRGPYLFGIDGGGTTTRLLVVRARPVLEALAEGRRYERGTITPIGSTHDWPVFADETIVGQCVAMGAGAHGFSLFVEADDLIRAYGATVADITVPE